MIRRENKLPEAKSGRSVITSDSKAYSLTGRYGDHFIAFHYGCGANGKGTLWEQVIFPLMGDYAVKLTDSLVYKDKRGNPPHVEIAGLCGKRFALGEENADGGNLNEAWLKSATGGDRQKGRGLYQDFIEYTPTAKIHLVGNHKPRITGRDEGIWRRFRLIDWPTNIPSDKRDFRLGEKLKTEFSGILNWAIRGVLEMNDQGTMPPASVLEATGKFRDDSDPFGDFLREKTTADPEGMIPKDDLFKIYQAYTKEQGMQDRHCLAFRAFNKRIAERGFADGKVSNGSTRVWHGIRGMRATDEAP